MAIPFAPDAVRNSLEAKKRELEADLARHGSLADLRALAATGMERQYSLLRQITDALIRLDSGEYGRCTRCGGRIASARLSFLPWTPHCLRCQGAVERENARLAVRWKRQRAGERRAISLVGGDASCS